MQRLCKHDLFVLFILISTISTTFMTLFFLDGYNSIAPTIYFHPTFIFNTIPYITYIMQIQPITLFTLLKLNTIRSILLAHQIFITLFFNQSTNKHSYQRHKTHLGTKGSWSLGAKCRQAPKWHEVQKRQFKKKWYNIFQFGMNKMSIRSPTHTN